ncbi:MAG TPA: 50S ribosomal protein L13 [Candidatus Paceibacterota bacterium]
MKEHHVDARGKVLGRLASEIALILQGKGSPDYKPNAVSDDKVYLKNYRDIVVTGRKADQKIYYRHTGYVGGIKQATYREMKEKDPKKTIQHAVRKMLPRNFLTSRRIKNLIFIEDQK